MAQLMNNRLPMRFSSIFCVGKEKDCFNQSVVMRRFFSSHAVVDVGRLAGVKLLISEPFGAGTITKNQTLRVEGPVITIADVQHTVLFSDPRYTIPVAPSAIDMNKMANKISVSSVGMVLSYGPRGTIELEQGAKLVTVLHRDWDPTRHRAVEFQAIYHFNAYRVLGLPNSVFDIGSTVNWWGNIIAYSHAENMWIVDGTEAMVAALAPTLRRSLRRRQRQA